MDTSSVSILYRYGSADTSAVSISYRYNGIDETPSVCPIVTRYAKDGDLDRNAPQSGFWAWSTQELGNLFPHWHMARHNPGGDTQRFINSWCMGLDDLKLAYAKFRKNLFIDTAETTQPHTFYYGPVVDYGTNPAPRSRNLLVNSSFSLKRPARYNLPLGWYVGTDGTVELVEVPTFAGTHSVHFDLVAGQYATLRQRFVNPIPAEESITASVWYMVPVTIDTIESDAGKLGLAIHVLYYDGTMDRVNVALRQGTSGRWMRAQVTAEATKEVFAITYSIYANADSDLSVYIGATQLEIGKRASIWREGPSGHLPYVLDTEPETARYESPVDVYVSIEQSGSTTETVVPGDTVSYSDRKSRKLTYISDQDTFWNWLVPSRCTSSVVTDVPNATSRTKLGWFTTPSDAPDVFPTIWRISGNKLEQANSANTSEVVGSFDIGEFYLEGAGHLLGVANTDEEPAFTRTLECLCVYQDKLWVVCKETFRGNTVRVLKVVFPKSQWPLPIAYDQGISMYLEAIGDVEVPVSTGTATYIGVIDEDPDSLLILISGTYYKLNFEYDYFMFDYDRRQVILRNEFTGGTIVTV